MAFSFLLFSPNVHQTIHKTQLNRSGVFLYFLVQKPICCIWSHQLGLASLIPQMSLTMRASMTSSQVINCPTLLFHQKVSAFLLFWIIHPLLCMPDSYSGTSHVFYMTAKDNLLFLRNWFTKFPQYRNRSLFIAGESYAGILLQLQLVTRCSFYLFLFPVDDTVYIKTGHYIPQLAQLMLEFNKKDHLFNLKGIAVSGCMTIKNISLLTEKLLNLSGLILTS